MFFHKNQNFYSSNLDTYMEQRESGSFGYLPLIFGVFAEDLPKQKQKVAQVLKEDLDKFSFDDIYKVDIQMRERTSTEWFVDWKKINVKTFFTKKMTEDERRAVLIFATFHTNGYIRQQALQLLISYPQTLPFLLLRCNDWVKPIRQCAQSLFIKRLEIATAHEIIDTLPLMEKLRRSKRCESEYTNILVNVANILFRNPTLIASGLRSRDMRTRRFCISILKRQIKDGQTKDILLTHIKYEKDPFLRKMIFSILLETNQNILELSKQFMKDKHPRNRILALQTLDKHQFENVLDIAEQILLDKNPQVRLYARNIIEKSERKVDIRQIYLNHLETNTATSICGLSEVGFSDDYKLIEKFLQSTQPSIIRSAMIALMDFDTEKFRLQITEMLASEYVGIVKTATLLLEKYRGYDCAKIFCIQENSIYENTKVKCASLLFHGSKWNVLIYTLMLIGSDYEKLENLCHIQISRWIASYNRSFAVATSIEKETIHQLLIEKKEFLNTQIQKQLLFLSK